MAEAAAYEFKPHERPTLPGSPANPDHPHRRRVAYFAIGVLVGIVGGLGNALVTVNLNFAGGTLGLYSDEAAWLTAAFLMTNTTANLLLVKYRQQFGLQPFIRFMLPLYALTTLFHIFVHDFWTAVLVRAANGLAASAMSTLALLYFMQSMPAARRMAGIMLGISVPQLATPIARAISPHLLVTGDWHMLYWFELGGSLAALAAIMALPLPPSERMKAFEPLDFLTFALLAPGLSLFIAVLGEGRLEWWTERAWMGWSLAAGVVLVTTALVIEHFRANPLINTRWLGTREMVRLMLIAASIRVLLSEQAFGSIGLMNAVGLINDQMVTLQVVVIVAMIAGTAAAILTFDPEDLSRPITFAVVLIAVGAFIDAGSTSATRPVNLYVSQALIGFASLLFLAQAMVIGLVRAILAGASHFVSFVVLFSLSQSVGGLFGTALLGTYQVVREKVHSAELVQTIVLTDPQVAARIAAGARSASRVVGDPVLDRADGVALLARVVAREANVLAFDDVFMLIGVLSVLTVIWGLLIRLSIRRRGEVSPVVQLQRRAAAASSEQG